MKFVLSDSSVNSYGFRLLSKGAKLTQFKKNPVLLYMHDRQLMPIGVWTNIRLEGDSLVAEPEFDEDDELAMKVKKKVEKGYLRAASVGIDVISTSDDPKLMVPGQTRSTVTEWEPYEASIVDVGSNKNALKLRNANGLILQGEVPEDYVDIVVPKIESNDMKQIALALGLKEDATEAEVLAAITKLSKPEEKPEAKQEKVEGPSKEVAASIIALGKSSGLINKDNEADYEKLVATHPNIVLNMISNHKGVEGESGKEKDEKAEKPEKEFSLAEFMKTLGKETKGEPAPKTWDEFQEKDPRALEQLKREKPEEFKKLYKAKYGAEPAL